MSPWPWPPPSRAGCRCRWRPPGPSGQHDSDERRGRPSADDRAPAHGGRRRPAKVHFLDSVILADGSETFPSLRADIDAITAVAAGLGDCRLIVIDPVSAYLKGIDDNRNAVLRGVLAPLNTLAERWSPPSCWSAT